MISLAFYVITLFLVEVAHRFDSTSIHTARCLYGVLLVGYFIYAVVKWSFTVQPDDKTDRDIEVSPGYPRLFAIGLIIEAIVYVVAARITNSPKVLWIVMIMSIIYAILFIILQASEAIEQKVHFCAVYVVFVGKEILAIFFIAAIPLAILGTFLQFLIMLTSLVLHIFKVPIYKLTPKKTFIWQLFTI